MPGLRDLNQERNEARIKHDKHEAIVINLLTPHEPETCKSFGCGKTLSLREQLFGGKCINHQLSPRQPDPTDFVKFH